MKVLHYINTYLPVTCPWIYDQINSLSEEDCYVLSSDLKNLDLFPLKNVYESRLNLFSNNPLKLFYSCLKLRFKILSLIKSKEINLLHVHFGLEGAILCFLLYGVKTPILVSFYGMDYRLINKNFKYRFFKFFLKNNNVSFTVEGNTGKKILLDYKLNSDKIFPLKLGVEVLAPKISCSSDKIILTIACTFKEKKGVLYAAEALKKLHPSIKDNLELNLIGEGDLKQAFLETIGIHDFSKVNCVGYVSRDVLLKYLNYTDIFLHPSVEVNDIDTEGGIPVVLIDACSASCCVVTTSNSDIGDLIINSKTGLIVNERDSEMITSAIEFLFENKNQISEIGLRANLYVSKYFSLTQTKASLIKIYKELI
jgi:glycosyltransferase involved in cell wall biosynthesis